MTTSSAPDVLGLPLPEATSRLEALGLAVRVTETSPPRGPIAGELRVVRQRLPHASEVSLTVAAFPPLPAEER